MNRKHLGFSVTGRSYLEQESRALKLGRRIHERLCQDFDVERVLDDEYIVRPKPGTLHAEVDYAGLELRVTAAVENKPLHEQVKDRIDQYLKELDDEHHTER